MRRGELSSAAGLIGRAVGRPEVLKRLHAQIVFRRWEECVGPVLASKSAPERFEGGTLWVAVSGASWAQELRMRKREILGRLNEFAGDELFKDARFGVRELPEITAQPTKSAPLEPEAVNVSINNPELAVVAKRALGKLKAVRNRNQA